VNGVFAEWQPRYAAHGITTFPVTIIGKDKKPAVKGYLKLGSKVSDQLALKFPLHDAIGLACRRNRITVLDVDTPDERVLADGLSRHGPTPFIVRSGSGHYQAWYRHNGERRRVRPDPARPIDILGDGYVVAPPSMGSKGRYEIIQGSMDDLERLPRMRVEPADEVQVEAFLSAGKLDGGGIPEGRRNDELWRHCMKRARTCGTIEMLMEEAMHYNSTEMPPMKLLSDAEVLKVVASAWDYERSGRNWIGRGQRVAVEFDVVDGLAAADPHAYALFGILQRHHAGSETFFIAKAMAESLNWTLRTFKAARATLLAEGLIECIHQGGRGPNDPAVYRFAKGCENAPQY